MTAQTKEATVREKVSTVTKRTGTLVTHGKPKRDLVKELDPLKLHIQVFKTKEKGITIDIYSNGRYIQLLSFPESGAGSSDIIISGKEYQINVFSESRVCQDEPEDDLSVSLCAKDIAKNTIENTEYIIQRYKYMEFGNGTTVEKGPGMKQKPKYDLVNDYTKIGNIHQYELWRKTGLRECLWVETGSVPRYYPMPNIQTAVEFFCLCQANASIKLDIDQAKAELGVKEEFYQDFTRIEYEEEVQKKAKAIVENTKNDFNDNMARLAMYAMMKMDSHMREPLLERLKKLTEVKKNAGTEKPAGTK